MIALPALNYAVEIVVATTLVLLLTGWALREILEVPDDSPAFKPALTFWAPVLLARYGTPRRIKRFINRLRFTALSDIPSAAADCTVWESLWQRYIKPAPGMHTVNSEVRGQEARLLLRSVLESCCGDGYRAVLDNDGGLISGWKSTLKANPELVAEHDQAWADQVMAVLGEQLANYAKVTAGAAPNRAPAAG